ncbi:regulator, partial [Cronobacter sakazakii]
KGDIAEKLWTTQHDLIAYANQADETRLLSTARTMGRLIGIAAPAATMSAPAISSSAKSAAAALPGFGSITGHTEGAAAVATAHTPAPESSSLVDEEILRAAEAEFKPEPEAAKAPEAAIEPTASATAAPAEEGLDDLLAELDAL